MWLFIDDEGATQGPFSSEQMRQWFNDGYFNENTRARLAHKTDVPFARLGDLFPDGLFSILLLFSNEYLTAARLCFNPHAFR